ncbi:MAG: sensor histidine kinase [Formosimonas sp.]
MRVAPRKKSLFGQIMLWMLLPLAILWPISLLINYQLGRSIADSPFDQNLKSNVLGLSQQMQSSYSQQTLSTWGLSVPTGDAQDSVYYQIMPLNGEVLMGSAKMPAPPPPDEDLYNHVQMYDAQLYGAPVRVAYMWQNLGEQVLVNKYLQQQPVVLIQVAETLNKREALARQILQGAILPQLIFLPIAILLVWFGLTRGIMPISRLQQSILERSPYDVSDLPVHDTPEEMEPLIQSFNHVLYRLRRQMAFQKRFLTDTAHQIKTPLAGLKAQAELALQTTDAEQHRNSLLQISASSERTAHLVSQLIALARTEYLADQQPPFEPLELVACVREQLVLLVDSALQKGLDVSFEAPEDEIWVNAHALLLGEMLKNLIDNAMYYTKSSVVVRVRRYLDAAFVLVLDDGVGIPEAERDLVYAPFYSVLGADNNGSGLGLAIVKQISELHNAQVRISDNPELPVEHAHVGCVFEVELPTIPRPRRV